MTHTHSQPGASPSSHPATSTALLSQPGAVAFIPADRRNRPPVRHGFDAAHVRASVVTNGNLSPVSMTAQLPPTSVGGLFRGVRA